MKYLSFTLFVILTTVSLSSCHKEGKDYKELYKERVILDYILTPTPNPQNACVQATQIQGTCFSQSTEGKQQPIFNETVFSYILSSTIPNNITIFKTYSTYCTSYLSSSIFNNFSDAEKQCVENCMQGYSQGLVNANSCNNQNMSTLYKNAATQFPLCVINCSKAVNN